MSHLKTKANINDTASAFLYEKGLYAPTVHCAYYSCVQLMLYLLTTKIYQNRAEFDCKSNELKIETKLGSHERMINLFTSYLRNNKKDGGDREWKDFNTEINQLKKLRTDSDYGDNETLKPDGENSMKLSESVIKLLKRV